MALAPLFFAKLLAISRLPISHLNCTMSLFHRTCLAILVSISSLATSVYSQQNQPVPLHNKTLVVWASPANLTQRGGSALTIEDRGSAFDAIVFGEIAEGKWMAGSEMFRRTSKDFANQSAETAKPNELVQIAVTYDGNKITLYRNAAVVSQYTSDSPPLDFVWASVNIGKRHRTQNDPARFAGSVDDARIYAEALSKEQIAELKPNVASTIKPWAWWDFNSAEPKDLAGRFLISELQGTAQIKDGKLVLDGKNANFQAKLGAPVNFVPETPSRPSDVPKNWLTFHLAHPGPGEAMPGDPNCAFYWKGKYHLHYIYKNHDGFVFAHVSSPDLIHWKWHPTTLTPSTTDHGMFSGTGFFTKEGKPAIIYHGEGSGRNQISIAQDDELEKWSPPIAVEPIISADQDGSLIANWDPDAWLDGKNYYALSGGSPGSGKPPTLFRSEDLKKWKYLGLFLDHDMPDVKPDEDISCPNFFKIGNKDMLLCISHTLGCRYYLGEWKNEKFTPDYHARMNWHQWDFFAPESVLTADGRRVMWAWCNLGQPQSGIQSLPRELSLPADGTLRIKPLRELETLRGETIKAPTITLKNNSKLLDDIHGDALEIMANLEPQGSHEFGLKVLCDAKGGNGVAVSIKPDEKVLQIGDIKAPFELADNEKVQLRIFIDKNVVEAFVNDRQAVIISHPYAESDTHCSLFTNGGTIVANIKAWNLKSIY